MSTVIAMPVFQCYCGTMALWYLICATSDIVIFGKTKWRALHEIGGFDPTVFEILLSRFNEDNAIIGKTLYNIHYILKESVTWMVKNHQDFMFHIFTQLCVVLTLLKNLPKYRHIFNTQKKKVNVYTLTCGVQLSPPSHDHVVTGV